MSGIEKGVRKEFGKRLGCILKRLRDGVIENPCVSVVLLLLTIALMVFAFVLDSIQTAVAMLFLFIVFLWFVWDSFDSAKHSIRGCLFFLIVVSALLGLLATAISLPGIQELSKWMEGDYGVPRVILDNVLPLLVALISQSLLYGFVGYYADRRVAVVSIAIVAGIMGMLAAGIGAAMQFIPNSMLISLFNGYTGFHAFNQEFDIRGMCVTLFQACLFPYWFSSIVRAITIEFRHEEKKGCA